MSFERGPNLDQQKEETRQRLFRNEQLQKKREKIGDEVAKASTFKELYEVIRRNMNDGGVINFDENEIQMIEEVRKGHRTLDDYTSVSTYSPTILFGFKKKIKELFDKEQIIRPESSPELPPTMPPHSEFISESEWLTKFSFQRGAQKAYFNSELVNYIKAIGWWDLPKIGARGLGTNSGEINGPLVYCDGEIAIFETPEGYLKVPFAEILGPDRQTAYGEFSKKAKEWADKIVESWDSQFKKGNRGQEDVNRFENEQKRRRNY